LPRVVGDFGVDFIAAVRCFLAVALTFAAMAGVGFRLDFPPSVAIRFPLTRYNLAAILLVPASSNIRVDCVHEVALCFRPVRHGTTSTPASQPLAVTPNLCLDAKGKASQ